MRTGCVVVVGLVGANGRELNRVSSVRTHVSHDTHTGAGVLRCCTSSAWYCTSLFKRLISSVYGRMRCPWQRFRAILVLLCGGILVRSGTVEFRATPDRVGSDGAPVQLNTNDGADVTVFRFGGYDFVVTSVPTLRFDVIFRLRGCHAVGPELDV